MAILKASTNKEPILRRERDSNPRYVTAHTLSKRAPSTTRPSLLLMGVCSAGGGPAPPNPQSWLASAKGLCYTSHAHSLKNGGVFRRWRTSTPKPPILARFRKGTLLHLACSLTQEWGCVPPVADQHPQTPWVVLLRKGTLLRITDPFNQDKTFLVSRI
jgi:hypothetical protein